MLVADNVTVHDVELCVAAHGLVIQDKPIWQALSIAI